MKVAVYTALFGPAPKTLPIPPKSDAVFVCFTDRNESYAGWNTIKCDLSLSPRHEARYFKIMSPERMFQNSEVTIWQDASFSWLIDPMELSDMVSGAIPLAAFAHPFRSRIKDEGAEVVRCGQAKAEDVKRQLRVYREDGFDTETDPQKTLTTTGLLVRWNSPEMRIFNVFWQEQIHYTLRDQLSVDYCIWKHGIPVHYLSGHYRDNPFVKYDRTRRIPTVL